MAIVFLFALLLFLLHFFCTPISRYLFLPFHTLPLVSQSKKLGKYAQFLVIFCDGNFRNTVGVWKRYSDFSELSRKVTHGHSESCAAVVTGLNPLSVTDDHDVEILPNAITSWYVSLMLYLLW